MGFFNTSLEEFFLRHCELFPHIFQLGLLASVLKRGSFLICFCLGHYLLNTRSICLNHSDHSCGKSRLFPGLFAHFPNLVSLLWIFSLFDGVSVVDLISFDVFFLCFITMSCDLCLMIRKCMASIWNNSILNSPTFSKQTNKKTRNKHINSSLPFQGSPRQQYLSSLKKHLFPVQRKRFHLILGIL